MAVTHMALVPTTPQVAAKSCGGGSNSWSNGINKLDWNAPSDTIAGFSFNSQAWRAQFLQRSSVDNNPPNPSSQFYSTTRKTPPVDSLWTTVFSQILGLESDWIITFQETVSHSKLYFYRLIFLSAPDGISSNGKELDSNIATCVQPFDLSICTTDSCTSVNTCQPRLIWDVPILYVPFITGSHVGSSECVGSVCSGSNVGCYKIHVSWTDVPVPLNYDIYKSNVGPDNLAFVANTATSPLNGNNDWYDSDACDRTIWYQFVAKRHNGTSIPSNIVKITY